MIKFNLLFFLFHILLVFKISGSDFSSEPATVLSRTDTVNDNQNLFKGRIWRNTCLAVVGDQFLFTKNYLPASLTTSGKTYRNLLLRYDIYKDEIIIPYEVGGTLQLNKEMVDSFSISFQNTTYRFTRIGEDSPEGLKGYFHVLYKGKSALYVKYIKEIYHVNGNNVNDEFFQRNQVYFVKDNKAFPIAGRGDLFRILKEQKAQIKEFISKNRIEVSKREPETFIPVIRYLDSLNK
jgi:hypothetical protein